MRYLSNIIKYDSVSVGTPLIIDFRPDSQGSAVSEPHIRVGQGIYEAAEAMLAEAQLEAVELKNKTKSRAAAVFEETSRQAAEAGRLEGLRMAENEEPLLLEKVIEAEGAALQECRCALEERQAAAAKQLNDEALAFAFSLAEKILGEPLDRTAARFSDLFCEREPQPAEDVQPAAPQAAVPEQAEAEPVSALQDGALLQTVFVQQPEPPGREATVWPPLEAADEAAAGLAPSPAQDGADAQNAETPLSVPDGKADDGKAMEAGAETPRNSFSEQPMEPQEIATEFEDLALLDSRSMQKLMRSLNMRELVTALKGAGPETMETILHVFPKRTQGTIRAELEFLGPVLVSDVENAQRQVVRTLHRLRKAGEIPVNR